MRGLGGVYQRGGVWWVRYSHNGQKIRETSGSENRADAVRLLRQRIKEIGQGRAVGPAVEKTTLADLAEMVVNDYRLSTRRSIDRVGSAFAHFADYFGKEAKAQNVTADRLTAYVTERRAQGAAPATVKNELGILKRGFNLALRAGRVNVKPAFPQIALHNTRTGFFEEADFRALLDHLPEYVRPLVTFLYLTGWRVGEARGLQWSNVDLRAGVIRIEDTKNREARTLPYRALPELDALIQAQRERTTDLERASGEIVRPLFHRDGKPIRDFRGAWSVACRKAGLPGKLVHDFRRSAVRRMERAGISRSVATKITGHKTESVYKRYAVVCEADISEGLAKLAASGKAPEPRKVVPFGAR